MSIIIAAHNEKANLEKLIPTLLAQKHEKFEIIIADDRSSDGTDLLLEKYSQLDKRVKNIRISEISSEITPKKKALEEAVSAAKYANLLFTDADCIPSSPGWIRSMTEKLTDEKEIILGYSPYKKETGMLNMLIRYETLYTGIQYLSFALKGIPYMGVGRNLAYKKKLFVEGKGFKKHSAILGGDDDLFVQQNATGLNTAIQINYSSAVYSYPKTTWNDWMRQKWRHLSVGKKYSLNFKLLLGILIISHIGFYFTLPLLISGGNSILALSGYIIRTSLLISIFTIISRKLNDKFKWFWLPLLDVIYIFFYIIVGIKAAVFKKNSWT